MIRGGGVGASDGAAADPPADPLAQGRRVVDVVFAVVALLAIPLTLLPPDQPAAWQLGTAFSFTVVAIAMAVLVPWERLPSHAELVPVVMYLVVIAFLRDAEAGAASGFGPLVLLPLVYTALRGTAVDVMLVSAGIAAMFAVPVLAFGGPAYPSSEWRRLVVWAILAPTVGLALRYLVGLVEDSNLALQRTVRTDPLTGLFNRRGYDELLDRELARARRTGAPLALALVDIDHFKRFNDTFGHQEGDLLLRDAARAWQASLREVDLLARWGGEEFVALLPDCPPETAADVADRLRAATPRGQTCSVGVAVWDRDEDPAALVERADAALYAAKDGGRDRVVVAASP